VRPIDFFFATSQFDWSIIQIKWNYGGSP
jgi:hypothetical protein